MVHSDYLPFPALGVLATCMLWRDKLCGALFPGVHQKFSSLLVCIPGLAPYEGRGNSLCLALCMNPSDWRVRSSETVYLGFFEWLPASSMKRLETVTKGKAPLRTNLLVLSTRHWLVFERPV